MAAATHPYIPRVGVVFDFDRTLASDTIDALCAEWGLDRSEWEETYQDPLGDHWDGIIKRGWALIQCGHDRGDRLTRDFFRRAARHIDIYPGVTELKDRLGAVAAEIDEDCEVELVVLSAGYIEMIEQTACEEAFDRTWAGSFHFNDHDEAVAVKRIISHPAKSLYLEAYAKGMSVDTANEPQTDRPDRDPDDMHVPFDQLIYVGDGLSDLKAFEFINRCGGQAIAVDKDEKFDHADKQTREQRVENLAPPDYSEGSQMLESLSHAVAGAARRAALQKQGQDQ